LGGGGLGGDCVNGTCRFPLDMAALLFKLGQQLLLDGRQRRRRARGPSVQPLSGR
jgi:hypothetical protein